MAGLPSLFALEGVWTLTRNIAHDKGNTDHFTGQTHFHRSGPRLIQDETGTLTVDGQNLEAKQRYIWETAGTALNVHFSDLRPFHSIPLNTAQPNTVHLCDPDRYEVTYNFMSWPDWSSTWRVEGPRKGYVMQSTYQRL